VGLKARESSSIGTTFWTPEETSSADASRSWPEPIENCCRRAKTFREAFKAVLTLLEYAQRQTEAEGEGK